MENNERFVPTSIPTKLKHLVILLGVNIGLRALWLILMHPAQSLDFEWYYTHAVQLANGQGYQAGNQYTAYWPIGYPYFLSLLFRMTVPSVWVGLCANALLSAGIVLLVYLMTFHLTRNPRIGMFASIGYTILPSQIEWNSVLGSEELFTFLLLFSIYLYQVNENRRKWWLTIVSGIVLGLSCDVRPIPLLFPLVVWVYEVWIRKQKLRKATSVILFFIIGLCIGISPVTIRNLIALHHFVLISTNGGVNLWQGIHADGSYFWSWNPKVNPLLAVHNDIAGDRIGTQVFLQYVLHHPIQVAFHAVLKWFFLFWVDWNVVSVTFEVMTRRPNHLLVSFVMWFNTVVYWLWMWVSVMGFRRGLKLTATTWKVVAFPLTYIVYNIAVFSFFPAWDRFRYPMMPLFAICFGMGVNTIIRHRRPTMTAGLEQQVDVTIGG